MLEKLAAVADFADQNGEYIIANDATQIIKEAQLWDALRTLFDPEHTPGLDRDTPFWKRLSKGWSRGKMDRNLGLVLAIMAERTKLNAKIDKLSTPIKAFQDEVNMFYDKLRNGTITSSNLSSESRVLKESLKDSLKLISSKELKQVLKMRERLEQQQLAAAERIKGLDEETKGNLISVLKGESLPGLGDKPMNGAEADNQTEALKRWLRGQSIKKMTMDDGAKTIEGEHQFREFMQLYGFNPKAVTDHFGGNADLQTAAMQRYPNAFSEMYRRAKQVQKYDAEMSEGTHRSQEGKKKPAEQAVPGAEPAKESKKDVITNEKKQVNEDLNAVDEELARDALKVLKPAETPASQKAAPATPAAEPAAKLVEPTAQDAAAANKRKDKTQRHLDITDLAQKAFNKGKKNKKEPVVAPAKEPEPIKLEGNPPVGSADDNLSLAASAAQRTGRQITRLGRVQQLRKLADDMQGDEDLLDVLDPLTPESEDLMSAPEGESFDEEKDYALHPDVEGDNLERQYRPEEYFDDYDSFENEDIRSNPANRGLSPDDDEWTPEPMHRSDPKLTPANKKEELEDVMKLLRITDRHIENLIRHSNPDNRWSDELTLQRLKREQEKLLARKEELSGLPEGWADDK